MKWIKKHLNNILIYSFCAFAMALFTIISFSCKTYAHEVINNNGVPELKSSNLCTGIDNNYAYRSGTGEKQQINGYICTTDLLVFDLYNYINVTVVLENVNAPTDAFICLYNENRVFITTLYWTSNDNTLFNNGNSCRFTIDPQYRYSAYYFTFTCDKNSIASYDVMINSGKLPLPFEYYNLYSSEQYIFTLNQLERYYYYEQYAVLSNCNASNNLSFVVVEPNLTEYGINSASIQLGNMYRYLEDNTNYSFCYTNSANCEAIIQLVNGADVINVSNGESFTWYSSMNTLRIYMINNSNDLGYFNFYILSDNVLNNSQLNTYFNEEINSLNNTISNLNDTLNARNQTISQLQIAYNDLNASYENMLNGNNFANLFFTIAETPFASFKQIWSVDFLGVNLAGFVTGILFIGVLIWVVKKIF